MSRVRLEGVSYKRRFPSTPDPYIRSACPISASASTRTPVSLWITGEGASVAALAAALRTGRARRPGVEAARQDPAGRLHRPGTQPTATARQRDPIVGVPTDLTGLRTALPILAALGAQAVGGLSARHRLTDPREVVVSDLAEPDFLSAMRSRLEGIDVGLLINNAGFTNAGDMLDNDLEREVRLLHVNCRAYLMLAHEFGKQMKARRRVAIVFVSSFFGFAPVPRVRNYAASKAYGLMLAEALAEELKETGVDVMALCPGVTRTKILETARVKAGVTKQMEDLITMDSREVVKLGLRGLGKRTTIVTGWYNTLLVQSLRFLPRLWHAKLAGLLTANLEKI